MSPQHDLRGIDAAIPIALLPIRIETRFAGTPAAPQLLVLLYPDDAHVDHHDPRLTQSELAAGRRYWTSIREGAAADLAWAQLLKEAGPTRKLRGLLSTGSAIPRPGMGVTLTSDVPLGDITSGTFSPTLKKGIGLAYVPANIHPEAELGVDVRGRREIFESVKLPFVDTSVRES